MNDGHNMGLLNYYSGWVSFLKLRYSTVPRKRDGFVMEHNLLLGLRAEDKREVDSNLKSGIGAHLFAMVQQIFNDISEVS